MPSPEWAKRKKQTLKIGHGGTLDSAARGVLGKRCEWKFDVTITYYRKKYWSAWMAPSVKHPTLDFQLRL